MSLEHGITIQLRDRSEQVALKFGQYSNGRTGLELQVISGEDAGQMMNGSVNIVDAFLPNDDYAAFRDYDFNKYVYDSLIKSGVIEAEPMTFAKTGYVTVPIHRFTDAALELRDKQLSEIEGE